MYLVVSVSRSVRPSVHLSINALMAEVGTVYQSEVFVCVSVISRHMRIIAQMQSIGF